VCEHCVSAVLTPWQLERFCRLFNLQPSELEANFNGWSKHVLLSRDMAFLFPRNPHFLNEFRRELALYEAFAHVDSIPLPKLVKRVKDKAISYYEFAAVTRLSGVPFSQFIETVSYEQFEKLLLALVEMISRWHCIPQGELPDVLPSRRGVTPKRTTVNNWHEKVLNAQTTEEAVDFIYRFVRRMSHPLLLPGALAHEADTKRRWVAVLSELARLPDVLVHADLHEESFLVDPSSLEITGILDWEAARLDNPVWDFNFGEWGMGICRWFDSFAALRRRMWQRYLETRGLSLSTVEGVHLFYTLWEMIWMVLKRKDRAVIELTGTDYETSVMMYLDRLDAVTASPEP